MSRMFLVFSLLVGLALASADWYVQRGRGARAQVPSYEGGTPMGATPPEGDVTTMEGGTPIPPPPK